MTQIGPHDGQPRGQSRQPAVRHAGGLPARDVPGPARPVLGDLLPGPAAGLPGPVRHPAGRLHRSGRARRRVAAAMVPARGDRDDLPVRDRGRGVQPAVRDHPRQLRAGAGQPAAAVVDPDRQVAQGAGAAGGPGRAGHAGGDPVRVRALPAARACRPAHPRRLRGRHGRVLQRTGRGRAQAGVDVLGGAAVAAVPAPDPLRHAAAARGRSAVDPDPRPVQPADLDRERGTGAVRGLME